MEFSYCGVFNITTGQLWPVSCIPMYNIFINVFIHGVISTFLLFNQPRCSTFLTQSITCGALSNIIQQKEENGTANPSQIAINDRSMIILPSDHLLHHTHPPILAGGEIKETAN